MVTTVGALSTAPGAGRGVVGLADARRPAGETGAQWAARFPPRPVASSWPQTRASRTQILGRLLAAPFALDNAGSQQTRRQGLLTVVGWLQAQAGVTWQQRWVASGAEDASDWRDMVARWAAGRAGGPAGAAAHPPHLSPGLLVLICGDVIRPSLAWLGLHTPHRPGPVTGKATPTTRTTSKGAAANPPTTTDPQQGVS